MSTVIGTIINDCADAAAQARQELRFETLFGVKPTFLGVGSYAPVEAAGNVVDQLDVLTRFPLTEKKQDRIVLVNVAPRAAHIKQEWDNGTPFCYFRLGKTLVVSTLEEQCLSLVRDMDIAGEVELLDVPAVTAAAVQWGDLTQAEANRINHSQFRSLEFLPLVAYWLWRGKPVPATSYSLQELPRLTGQVWQIDNFCNAKTTLLPRDIGFGPGKTIKLAGGIEAVCYRRLADVPDGVTALTIGSSGYGPDRFLELVIGGCGQASVRYGLRVGSPVTVTKPTTGNTATIVQQGRRR
jgi:hypothetical protein